jgi:hypothetical protein
MPVTFQTEKSGGAIITTARGIVPYAELVDHIAAKAKQGLMACNELFDARDINLDLSLSELQGIAEQTKKALGSQRPGKIAVVTNNAFVYGLARAYAVFSREDNPHLKVFKNTKDAHAWLLLDKSESND